ncbi:membrane hypothetical protein [Novosphingobium sp. KN65.2]|nr:membrane hypothetical protein [Novosphingobium sp. KN65.2]
MRAGFAFAPTSAFSAVPLAALDLATAVLGDTALLASAVSGALTEGEAGVGAEVWSRAGAAASTASTDLVSAADRLAMRRLGLTVFAGTFLTDAVLAGVVLETSAILADSAADTFVAVSTDLAAAFGAASAFAALDRATGFFAGAEAGVVFATFFGALVILAAADFIFGVASTVLAGAAESDSAGSGAAVAAGAFVALVFEAAAVLGFAVATSSTGFSSTLIEPSCWFWKSEMVLNTSLSKVGNSAALSLLLLFTKAVTRSSDARRASKSSINVHREIEVQGEGHSCCVAFGRMSNLTS